MATTPHLESDIRAIKDSIDTEVKAALEIRANAERLEGGILKVDKADGEKHAELVKSLQAKKAELDELKFLREMSTLEDSAAPPVKSHSLAAATSGETKSLGRRFLESDAFTEMKEAHRDKMDRPFEVEGDLTRSDFGRKDIYSTVSGTPSSMGGVQRDSMVAAPQRPVFVADLFPAQATNASVIEYFRVTGFNNSAAPVSQYTAGNFTLKPHSDLQITGFQAPVRTIAHYEAAHRSVLSDEPMLQGIIEQELMHGLRLSLDNQILNGDNTGENLDGLLQVDGTNAITQGTTPSLSTDNGADVIRRAITLTQLAYFEPSGIVMHPADWENIELAKSAGSEKLYLFNNAQAMISGVNRLWGLPVVTTASIAEGTALVGAFGTGATLYNREQSNIRISDSHSDFFVRNAIVILAETRAALAVKRPSSFSVVTLS